MDAEYLKQVERLPSTATKCACGFERLSVELQYHGFGHACFACPFCEVRVIGTLEDDDHVDAILRHVSDPAYAWLPEHMREPCAWAGFGPGVRPYQNPQRYTVQHGIIWANDPHLAISTGLPAEQIAEWRALLPPKTNHLSPETGLAAMMNRPNYKQVQVGEIEGRNVRCGSVPIAADYLQMVQALHPSAVPFAGMYAGPCNSDPVLFKVNGQPVALVMPVWL